MSINIWLQAFSWNPFISAQTWSLLGDGSSQLTPQKQTCEYDSSLSDLLTKCFQGKPAWEQEKERGKQDRKEKEAMQGSELRQSLPEATFILILQETMDCVHPKGDQSWVFIGRTDAEAKTPVLWPPHEKSWLIGKDPDAGKNWGQEEKGTTEDEIAGWHHCIDGHEFE